MATRSIIRFAKREDGVCIFVGKPQDLIDKYKENTNNDG